MNHRIKVLEGVREAANLHVRLNIKSELEASGAPVDVFGAIRALGAPLLFRPLDKLLGACVRVDAHTSGIIITTERTLHLQRFTAAHELGHLILEHDGSLDDEVGVPPSPSRNSQEAAADAFAAEFLLPRWLILHHAKKHRWTKQELKKPTTTYQLSLRLNTSYEATCVSLGTHNILTQSEVAALRSVSPKQIKEAILGDIKMDDWTSNVWSLDNSDDGQRIEAGPGDIYVVDVPEHSGAGYLWDASSAVMSGFNVVRDTSSPEEEQVVGGRSQRRIVMISAALGVHNLELSERRPWENGEGALSSLSLKLSNFGRERTGLLRRERPLAESYAH